MVVCLASQKRHLCILWGLEHIGPIVLIPTELNGAVLVFTRDVAHRRLPQSCRFKPAWIEFTE